MHLKCINFFQVLLLDSLLHSFFVKYSPSPSTHPTVSNCLCLFLTFSPFSYTTLPFPSYILPGPTQEASWIPSRNSRIPPQLASEQGREEGGSQPPQSRGADEEGKEAQGLEPSNSFQLLPHPPDFCLGSGVGLVSLLSHQIRGLIRPSDPLFSPRRACLSMAWFPLAELIMTRDLPRFPPS